MHILQEATESAGGECVREENGIIGHTLPFKAHAGFHILCRATPVTNYS